MHLFLLLLTLAAQLPVPAPGSAPAPPSLSTLYFLLSNYVAAPFLPFSALSLSLFCPFAAPFLPSICPITARSLPPNSSFPARHAGSTGQFHQTWPKMDESVKSAGSAVQGFQAFGSSLRQATFEIIAEDLLQRPTPPPPASRLDSALVGAIDSMRQRSIGS